MTEMLLPLKPPEATAAAPAAQLGVAGIRLLPLGREPSSRRSSGKFSGPPLQVLLGSRP